MTSAPAESGALAERLTTMVSAFARIGELQMKDLPIYNHFLEVEAIGFRPFGHRYVGALLTPWFLNLISLPRQFKEQPATGGGQETINLPSGPHVFLSSFDAEIGTYYSKSLLSALFHLRAQEDARAEAIGYLSEIMTPAAQKTPSNAQPATDVSRRDFFRGKIK